MAERSVGRLSYVLAGTCPECAPKAPTDPCAIADYEVLQRIGPPSILGDIPLQIAQPAGRAARFITHVRAAREIHQDQRKKPHAVDRGQAVPVAVGYIEEPESTMQQPFI